MSKITEYIHEAHSELVTKVTWPSWKELQDSAVIVAVACLIFALIVSMMDFVAGANTTQYWKGVLGMYYEYVVKG